MTSDPSAHSSLEEAEALPNPLIPGLNPDPSCVRVGDDFYIVTSSFEYLPALPVYHSRDMRRWTHITNVAPRSEQIELAQCPSGAGVWAPTIRHHRGTYYVIVTVANSPRGCLLFTAQDPAGPWSDGTPLPGVYGIDPDLAWDGDQAYVTFCGLHLSDSRIGPHDGIVQARVDLSTGELLEEPRRLWSGTGLTAPEGPHLHQRDGSWYLFIAEGGTARGHAVSVARGDSIEGPFEGAPRNPILTAAGTDRPVVSTGHADLVSGPGGRDLLVLLGTRPVDAAGAYSVLGRETFVTPLHWQEGWPTASPVELAPRVGMFTEAFDLAGPDPLADPGWLAARRSPSDYVATPAESRAGWLTLRGEPGGMRSMTPAFIGRRQRHLDCAVEVEVDPGGGSGGLALRFDERSSLALVVERTEDPTTNRVRAEALLPGLQGSTAVEVPSGPVTLQVRTRRPTRRYPPWSEGGDVITLSVVAEGGQERHVAQHDGRYWAVETATAFTGRVIGVLANRGDVHFRRFHYTGAART